MRSPKGRVPDGRVFDIRDIKAEKRYLHPDYEYLEGDGSLADNDRLLVFELRPKISGLPSFVGRWDGGNRAIPNKIRYDLDIDIRNVSKEQIGQFKDCKNGYGGHHPVPVGENKYTVHLTTPAGLVFDATISFSKHHAILLTAAAHSSVTLTRTKRLASIFESLKAAIFSIRRRIAGVSKLASRQCQAASVARRRPPGAE
jgi:hypothetical protein